MVLVVEVGEVDLDDCVGGTVSGWGGGGDCSCDDGPAESLLAWELDFFLFLLGLEEDLWSLTLIACKLLFFLESGERGNLIVL